MFINITNNAVKYNNENTIIEVISRINNGVAVFKIIDKGEGIGKQHIDKTFNLFYRIENSANSSERGARLGLYISKQQFNNLAILLAVPVKRIAALFLL